MSAQWPYVWPHGLWQEVQHRKSFYYFSMWGKDHHRGDHPQSEPDGGGGGEEDRSGQLQEDDRHPLPPQLEIYCIVIEKIVHKN